MITIGNTSLKINLHAPDAEQGYYRGTRFDHSGVFEGIYYKGCNYTEEWFEAYSPEMHDAVCGAAEEFSPIGFDDAAPGAGFLKIGVGVLERLDEQPYDRFRLHKILDYGSRRLKVSKTSAIFGNSLRFGDYGYDYEKTVEVLSDNSFRIGHSLRNTGSKALKGDVYNHNFFTLGTLATGASRKMDFPFSPEGDWRAEYESVGLDGCGIRFRRTLERGESVYMGNLHEAGKGLSGSPNAFRLTEESNGKGVEMTCARPMTKTVFWANHRIACLEPYIDFDIPVGGTFEFDIIYDLI